MGRRREQRRCRDSPRIGHGDEGVRGDRVTATDGLGERGIIEKKSADNLGVEMPLEGRRTAPESGSGRSVSASGTRMPQSTGGGTAPGGSTGNLQLTVT